MSLQTFISQATNMAYLESEIERLEEINRKAVIEELNKLFAGKKWSPEPFSYLKFFYYNREENLIDVETKYFPQYDYFKTARGNYRLGSSSPKFSDDLKKVKNLNTKFIEILIPILNKHNYYKIRIPFAGIFKTYDDFVNYYNA